MEEAIKGWRGLAEVEEASGASRGPMGVEGVEGGANLLEAEVAMAGGRKNMKERT